MTDDIPTTTSNKGNLAGAFIFGFLLVGLIIYVVVKIDCLEPGKLRIIGFVCALLAGLAGGFMSGGLGLKWAPDSTSGQFAIRGVGGMALFALVLWWWLASPPVPTCQQIYRVRVNVVDNQKSPVNDFEIWNSLDNQRARASDAWIFEVPAAKKPADGNVLVYATKKTAYLSGQTNVALASNFDITVSLSLQKDTSARIRGRVQDTRGNPVGGVRVSVYQHESEEAVTGSDGRFDLPAHAAASESVQLYARKGRYDSREWFPAGDSEATVTLRAR